MVFGCHPSFGPSCSIMSYAPCGAFRHNKRITFHSESEISGAFILNVRHSNYGRSQYSKDFFTLAQGLQQTTWGRVAQGKEIACAHSRGRAPQTLRLLEKGDTG